MKEIKLKRILYNLMKNDGFRRFLTLWRISTRPIFRKNAVGIDTVYFLGDLCGPQSKIYADKYFRYLNGNIIWVKGNHDEQDFISSIKLVESFENDFKGIRMENTIDIVVHLEILLEKIPDIFLRIGMSHSSSRQVAYKGKTALCGEG